MSQKITLSLNESNVKFAKRKAKTSKTSVSKIVDGQLDLLRRIEEALKKEKLHPWVKEFGGMIDTGKNEDPKNLF